MKKLKIILHSNYLYIILLIIILLIGVRLTSNKKSLYKENETNISAVITRINVDGSLVTLNLKGKEKLIAYYNFKTEKEKEDFSLKLGDEIKVLGQLTPPKENTTENTFNYKKYLLNKNIHFILNVKNYKVSKKNNNIYYKVKNMLNDYLNKNPYLTSFVLGDKSLLKKEVKEAYQNIGVCHLFAISGMHIALFTNAIMKLLNNFNINKNKKYLYLLIILFSYLLLIGPTPSVLRVLIFLLFKILNEIYNLDLSNKKIFLITLLLVLLYNPFYVYEVAFIYSFLISFVLIDLDIGNNNYFISLFKVSIISFFISLPITLYNFYQINLLSIIFNLFYVPLISLIIFPLSILSLLFPILVIPLNILTETLENITLSLNNINAFKLIFPKVSIFVYILEIILIYFVLKNKKMLIIIYLQVLLIHYNFNLINNTTYITFIDVGQGDSTLIFSKNEAILIDTGGKNDYGELWKKRENSQTTVEKTTIPLLKSLGIRKLKYLILTHGDNDHLGDASILLKKFEVENIVINNNDINENEKLVLKNNKNYFKAQEKLQLNCGDIELIQLNKKFKDENDSSLVFLAIIKGKNVLLTGDASAKTENYLLSKYELPEIDVLKVAHHGSNTSSSKKFIDKIKPKKCIISVGKNNRYGHPKSNVLETLKKYCTIYRTDEQGSINLKSFKNQLKVKVK